MSEFVVSNWWLLLLAIIVVAVIAKSLLKIAITLVILVIVFVLFWEVFISSGFSKSTQCFMNEAKSADTIFQKAQAMSPGVERNHLICSEDEASYQSLISCLKQSKQENGLSFALYSSLPKFNKTINETINSHNKLCPEAPLVLPSF